MADVTIKFHGSQWDNLPYDVRRRISAYCGPLWPDAKGVIVMTMDERRWAEIQAATIETQTE